MTDWLAFFEDVQPRGGVDVLCYTPEEFEQKKKEELGTVGAAAAEGIILYRR